MPLTPSQARAVETTGRDLCVVAGAGSGKTRVLAERFAHLVLEGAVPQDRILALTFTDKAAVEMRLRVARLFAARGRADLRRDLEGAWVGTFHSFCARLLKENAVEAGIDPAFTVLTETEADVRRERAREATAERLLAIRPGDFPALARLAASTAGLAEDLTGLLDRGRSSGVPFADLLAAEADPPAPAQSVNDLRGALETLRRNRDGYTEAGLTRADRVLDAARAIPWEAAAAEDPAAYEEAVGPLPKAVNLSCGSPAKEDLAAVRAAAESSLSACTARRAAVVARVLAVFLEEWDRAYDREKGLVPDDGAPSSSRGMALDFADLERSALRLLEGSPEALEEVRERFEHVLVDEYQDTNPLQERLLALVRPADRLFVVGDPKQAIYGFRGADHRGFTRARDAAGPEGTVPLRENFRSRPEVLAFVNAVLRPAFEAGGAAQVPWEPLLPGAEFGPKEAPSVEVHLVADAGAEGLGKGDLQVREAALLADRLKALVEGGGAQFTARDSGGRPLSWGDAALLLRATTDIQVYERALVDRDIPYAVVQGRGFHEAREVVDLGNLLEAVENPRNELALASVLRSPFGGLDDDALLALAQERSRLKDGVLSDAVLDRRRAPHAMPGPMRRRLDRFRAVFGDLRALRGRGRLLEIVEHALRETGFADAVLLQRNGRQRHANLRKVRERARVFEADGEGGLTEFVRALRRLRLREERETEAPLENEEAVSLLTVHQAKGLEWPLVVVPDLGRRPNLQADPFLLEEQGGRPTVGLSLRGPKGALRTPTWNALDGLRKSREAAEGLRVLHVAMTRAQEHLVLSACEPRRGGAGPWLKAVREALGEEDPLGGEPGSKVVEVAGDPPAGVLVSRVVSDLPRDSRRPVSIFESRRSRLLAGRGPGVRASRAERAAAKARVAAVVDLPPIPTDGTPYLATVSALLDFEACPLRYRLGHVLGVPDRSPPLLASPEAPDAALALGSALARTDGAPPAPATSDGSSRGVFPGADDEDSLLQGPAPRHGVPRWISGVAVHAVLGRLNFSRDGEDEVREAAKARLREDLEGDPPKAAVEEVVEWVGAFRASAVGREVGEAFERPGSLLREVPFLFKEEGVLLRGQIDLVWRDAKGSWTVADYKASRSPKRREKGARYERQLHLYARALAAMPLWRDAPPARGALVYLDPKPKVVPVPLGAAELESARALLARFAVSTRGSAFPPDRSHCFACPFGPNGAPSCTEAPGRSKKGPG